MESGVGRRRRYHHGELRAQLIHHTLAIAEASGPEAITLREVARRAGVSHAAPYRHFRDLGALIRAAGEAIDAALASHLEAVPHPTPKALVNCVVGYATDHPGHFRLVLMASSASGVDIESRARHVFTSRLQDTARGEHRDLLWGYALGIATLCVRGELDATRRPRAIDAAAGLIES